MAYKKGKKGSKPMAAPTMATGLVKIRKMKAARGPRLVKHKFTPPIK
jgi:hypothetical protein